MFNFLNKKLLSISFTNETILSISFMNETFISFTNETFIEIFAFLNEMFNTPPRNVAKRQFHNSMNFH
jgi:hypothetical protein